MDVLKITDDEVYKLGIEALAAKLGVAGVSRFLKQIQPLTGDYSINKHKPPKLDSVPTSQKVKNEHSIEDKK